MSSPWQFGNRRSPSKLNGEPQTPPGRGPQQMGVSTGVWLKLQRFVGQDIFAGDDFGAGGAEEVVAGAEEAVVVGRLGAGLEPRGFLLLSGHNDHTT